MKQIDADQLMAEAGKMQLCIVGETIKCSCTCRKPITVGKFKNKNVADEDLITLRVVVNAIVHLASSCRV